MSTYNPNIKLNFYYAQSNIIEVPRSFSKINELFAQSCSGSNHASFI